MDEKTAREFPNLLALAGHTKNGAPHVTDKDAVTPETALALEQACSGGCLAAAKTGLDYYNFKKSARRDFALCIVEGEGVLLDGERWWFDKTGKPYSLSDIARLPMRKMALGNCAMTAKDVCGYLADGCCDPAKCMAVVCHAAGVTMPIMSLKNKSLAATVVGMLGTVLTRKKLIRSGRYVDCPQSHEDRIFGLPALSLQDAEKNHIAWPLPPMSRKEKCRQLLSQWSIVFSAVDGGRSKKSDLIQLTAYLFATILWLAGGYLAWRLAWPWLLIGLFTLHLLELIAVGYRTGGASGISGAKSILMCMLFGFLWWLPIRRQQTVKDTANSALGRNDGGTASMRLQ